MWSSKKKVAIDMNHKAYTEAMDQLQKSIHGLGGNVASIPSAANWAGPTHGPPLPPLSRKAWPSLLHDGDAQDLTYFNEMTDAILQLREEIASLKDREDALLERIEMLEDEVAS